MSPRKLAALSLAAGLFTGPGGSQAQEVRPDDVIALERAALDRWGRGTLRASSKPTHRR